MRMEAVVDPTPAAEALGAVVLVVDDEPAIRRFVVRALEKDGVLVVEAPDGRVALEAFNADPDRFDAIFCDLSLRSDPEGEDVVRAVRSIRPSFPVVVMTGHHPTEKAEEMGVVGSSPLEWLWKPFSLAAVGEMLHKVVVLP
jgi:DNA-binding NtrC family response regulator